MVNAEADGTKYDEIEDIYVLKRNKKRDSQLTNNKAKGPTRSLEITNKILGR